MLTDSVNMEHMKNANSSDLLEDPYIENQNKLPREYSLP